MRTPWRTSRNIIHEPYDADRPVSMARCRHRSSCAVRAGTDHAGPCERAYFHRVRKEIGAGRPTNWTKLLINAVVASNTPAQVSKIPGDYPGSIAADPRGQRISDPSASASGDLRTIVFDSGGVAVRFKDPRRA